MSRFFIWNSICIALLLVISCQTIPTSDYSGSNQNLNLIASIKNNAKNYISDRSILWVESGYLTKEEANLLQGKIDNAIIEIEKFISIKYDSNAYKGKTKIEYFIHSGREASHTITEYEPRKYMSPVIFLTYVDKRRAPYVHETVHIIAWDWNTLWLKEGLAVFLNDKLGGYPAFPNFGIDIDQSAKLNLGFKSALNLVGQNGIPKLPSREERRIFYILSGSFVKYLHTHIGTEKLMKIYKAKDTKKAVAEITATDIGSWKKDWIKSLE
jgi:hypothetical protein